MELAPASGDPVVATWRVHPSGTTSAASHDETIALTVTANP